MAHISEAAPLQISRFYTGLFTFRNPLIVPIKQMGRRIIELYDAISDGVNMECTNRLTLARRPGYTALSPFTTPNSIFKYFYSFKPSAYPGQIYQVVDSTDAVWSFQPGADVSNTWTGLVAKPTPALTNFATVSAYCYMAQETFAKKWDSLAGPQGVTNWGIAIYNSQQTQGPKLPLFANPTVGGLGSVWFEVLPNWAVTVPASPTGLAFSQWIKFGDYIFTFSFPGINPEVSGIKVTIPFATNPQGEGTSFTVRLLRNQVQYGTPRTITSSPVGVVIASVDLGGPGDLWDAAWTFNDINQPGFGVSVQAVNTSTSNVTFTIGNPQITVYVNYPPAFTFVAPPPGQSRLTPQIGYFYKYAYGNSHSGHVSSPTPPSFSGPEGEPINPGTNAVQLIMQSSSDLQVDVIHVFRTTDGGGNPYYELPNSPVPNGAPGTAVTITDFADDTALQINNVCPDPEFNNPPPGGAIDPVWFAGRLWMHRGHQLFFSSGPDVTMGNGEEAWYPVYVFSVPTQIIRKFATPNGMFLVCLDDILIVRGISTASFTVNDFAKDIGMRTWTAGDTDGTNSYIYTSDRQFLLLNPNGFASISGNVADTISAVDPTKAYVSMFRYTALENWIFLADGSTFIYPYNAELVAWATKQAPVDGVGAIGTVELTPGVYQLWRAKPVQQSTISFRDSTVFADEGAAYPCFAVFGPITVADFLTLAQMRDIALTTVSTTSQVTLSVLANEVFPLAGSQFQILQVSSTEPPELSATPSLSFIANRYTWKSAPLPELINFYFKRIDFSADPNPDEIWSWTAGGTQTTGGSSLGQPGQLPQLQGR